MCFLTVKNKRDIRVSISSEFFLTVHVYYVNEVDKIFTYILRFLVSSILLSIFWTVRNYSVMTYLEKIQVLRI